MFGIGPSALDGLLNRQGTAPRRMIKNNQRIGDSAATYQAGYYGNFARAHTDAFSDGLNAHFFPFAEFAAVAAEFAGRAEFSQLVANHIL